MVRRYEDGFLVVLPRIAVMVVFHGRGWLSVFGGDNLVNFGLRRFKFWRNCVLDRLGLVHDWFGGVGG